MDARSSWEHFAHGADIGVAGHGPTVAAAFEGAAVALTAVITEPAAVAPRDPVPIRCTAPDLELLLVAWLDAVVYEIAVRRMLFARFDVAIEGTGLVATAWGEPIDVSRHAPAVEIKGATLTELAVCQDPAGTWTARTVVDV